MNLPFIYSLVVSIIVTVAGFLVQPTWRCPPSHNHHFLYRYQCYEFILNHDVYWDEARDDCKARGGRLTVIPNLDTQNFLYQHLLSLKHQHSVWIGLSDKDHESTWKWTDGSNLHGYNNWGNGQGHGFLHEVWDCAIIKVSDSGKWHDVTCHTWPEKLGYICQHDAIYIPAVVPKTTPTTTRRTTPSTTTTTSTTTKTTTSTRKTTTQTTTPTPTPTTPAPTTQTTTTPTTTPTTTSTTPTTTSTTPTTTTTIACTDIDCQTECVNGYSGIFVGPDGCIKCRCLR